jgi:hypothetical protein
MIISLPSNPNSTNFNKERKHKSLEEDAVDGILEIYIINKYMYGEESLTQVESI